ncbi:MAG: hypothetical protein KAI89_07585 [Emcibacter sp.]|nr:hypothetical protein [Emcibacter sp.]
MNARLFKAIILPGLIFQSVVIAGGYATGRELVEFFLTKGPLEGLLGIGVATIIWSAVLALSFELSRMTASYDYKSFFQHLLGRGWLLFEISYAMILVLVLSVIGTAAGAMFAIVTGLPSLTGTLLLVGAIGFLTFKGSATIEKVLAGWSMVLYLVYAAFLFWGFKKFGPDIIENFTFTETSSDWFVGGIKYASYNLAVVPTILFCVSHIKSRKEAFTAGILGGLLAIIPGVLFYLVMVGFYPAILTSTVPVNDILGAMQMPLLLIIFNIVIFGTFIETGTALLHAVNERIAGVYKISGKKLPRYMRPAVALVLMVLSIFVGEKVGLINLIANGYGILTYVFLAVFILPLFTIGVYKIIKSEPEQL